MHQPGVHNVGHLYEGAVAHYQATGKRGLLDVRSRMPT
ncbi:MAG: glycoside hydrolase family 127 protein [Anaerolineales bacterium]|nr:glycoside hydrolase family 127 protein [Anaerolineales bacterium]